MKKIVIDPVTRIEGHLKVEVTVDGGVVKEARSSGTLFRGFEVFLRGRDPRDAARITQRVCGVCPTSHATASALALDDAFGVAGKVPGNGRILRNLILGMNFLQSHILHFYTLSALDFVDVAALDDAGPDEPDLRAVKRFLARGELGPFVPRYEGDFRLPKDANRGAIAHYLEALKVRRLCHEMGAVFGGRMPLQVATCAGGVFSKLTDDMIVEFGAKLAKISDFIDNAYIPDILAVARAYPDHFEAGRGVDAFLAWGGMDAGPATGPVGQRKRFLPPGVVSGGSLEKADASKVTEQVRHSFFSESCAAAPADGRTEPEVGKDGAYSWLKSPRYDGAPHEVGPMARTIIAYLAGAEPQKSAVDGLLAAAGLSLDKFGGTLGRHAARALETKLVADAMKGWLQELTPGEPVCADCDVPVEGRGAGLTEAPRGALGHWIDIADKKVRNYQLVVPTTWNASPRDADGTPGPVEQALVGVPVKDEENPADVVRVVRSFDPCLACAVHLVRFRGGAGRVARVC